jgi:hypothetical protein
MSKLLTGLGAIAATVFYFAQASVFFGTSLGVVREHCLDVESSVAAQRVDVDNKWTYILWPPLTLANLDPSGTCVRSAPLREALGAIGVWKLDSPEEQVRVHLEKQGAFDATSP